MNKNVVAYKLGRNRSNVYNNIVWAMVNFGLAVFLPGPKLISVFCGILCLGFAYAMHRSSKKIEELSGLDEDFLNNTEVSGDPL